ncbi:hypothetical protein BKA61DRAFT_601511 [Leptodontidium sp. MPI-SDFR-AT-0119]|nr:hypothetical protein BKA61DRAFT_601511 [Leptodontidium sp. MPI-SDFR-AT-0119]
MALTNTNTPHTSMTPFNPANPTNQFHKFALLPTEPRLLIWEEAIIAASPSTLTIETSSYKTTSKHPFRTMKFKACSSPNANYESRQASLRLLSPSFGPNFHGPHLFNFARDVLILADFASIENELYHGTHKSQYEDFARVRHVVLYNCQKYILRNTRAFARCLRWFPDLETLGCGCVDGEGEEDEVSREGWRIHVVRNFRAYNKYRGQNDGMRKDLSPWVRFLDEKTFGEL